MNISFTLNQAEALALSEARYGELYSVMRSFTGIKIGELWTKEQFSVSLSLNFCRLEDRYGIEYWMIRGVRYDVNIIMHAISVRSCLIDLKLALQFVKLGGPLKPLSQTVKALKQALAQVEW